MIGCAAKTRIPPPGADLEFARNTVTGTVHILCHVPERGEPGYTEPEVCASFAEGLAAMFTTPRRMLCGVRLLVGGADDWPAVWVAGDDFADGDLCVSCVLSLGDQQWRAFHVDNRGPFHDAEGC
jgi:hypothetical protein